MVVVAVAIGYVEVVVTVVGGGVFPAAIASFFAYSWSIVGVTIVGFTGDDAVDCKLSTPLLTDSELVSTN